MVIEKIQRKKFSRKSRKRLSVEADKTIYALFITLTISIITLAGSYFFISSQSAQKNYLLSQEKEKNNKLVNQNQSLETKLNEVLSFDYIEEKPQVKNMETPETREFIDSNTTHSQNP